MDVRTQFNVIVKISQKGYLLGFFSKGTRILNILYLLSKLQKAIMLAHK